MNKKRLLCVLLSLTAVFSMLFIKESAAWIDTETGEPVGQNISVKKLNFEFKGTLGSCLYTEDGEQYIITEQNLIIDNEGKITGVNHSTVDTEIRWRVVYDTPSQENAVYEGREDEHIVVNYEDIWNFSDGYFYGSFDASDESEVIDFISYIGYNEEMVTKEEYLPEVNGVKVPFSGNIKIEIQAKQKDFVEWTDIWTVTA